MTLVRGALSLSDKWDKDNNLVRSKLMTRGVKIASRQPKLLEGSLL